MPFEAFQASGRGRRRSGLAWLAAVAIHVGLVTLAVLRSWWHLEEVQAAPLVITFNPSVPPAPAEALAGSRARVKPQSKGAATATRTRALAQPAPPSLIEAAPREVSTTPSEARREDLGNDGNGAGDGDGPRGHGHCTSDCDAVGPAKADAAPVVAPPTVGAKQCLACPLPRVSPAYLRVAGEQQALAKICVGADGRVTEVRILRGISAEQDAQIRGVIEGWRFSPMTIDDRPVRFCYVSRFTFTLE